MMHLLTNGQNKLLHTVLVSLFLLPLALYSQVQNVPFSLGIGGGIDWMTNKDEAASPLAYQGIGLPVGINGFRLNEKWLHQFELRLIIPLLTNNYPLKTPVNTRLKNWVKIDVKYQLLHRVGFDSKNYIGGGMSSNFFLREYNFLDGLSWEWKNTLRLNLARKVDLTDKAFLLPQIGIPILGNLHRKPSLTFDEAFLDDFYQRGATALTQYGKWKFNFVNWAAFEFDLLYHWSISERLNVQGSIGFHYYTIDFPARVHHINLPLRWYLNYQL